MVAWETLRLWLQIWEQLLKEPRELALGCSFANALRAANTEFTKSSHPNKGWRRDLVGELRSAFDDHDPVVDVYRLAFPTEMAHLDQLVHRSPVNQAAFTQIAQSPVLPLLADGPSLSVLQDQLHDVLTNHPQDRTRLTIVTGLLLRAVLDLHAVKDLQPLPERSLPARVRRPSSTSRSVHWRAMMR